MCISMKNVLACALCLALALSAACAWAETPEDVLHQLTGLEWSFCSGAGAWSTDLRIQSDGSFTGEYHDSEMGETGDGYPDGTVYGCSFSGRLTVAERADEYSWKVRVDALALDEGQVPEAIEDGIRFVTTDVYGLSEGDEMRLYRPGTPLEVLSEDMRLWTHAQDLEDSPAALETWFLCSEANESGFVGESYEAYLANPWEEMTAEQLADASGLRFGVPEGAENIIYRYLRSENLAEMQFTLDADECCARVQPAALQEGEWMNISGMYFAWENEEAVTIGTCSGTIGQAQTGSEEWVELCVWYDRAQGLVHSLSVYTTDLDGLDVTAIAEQI